MIRPMTVDYLYGPVVIGAGVWLFFMGYAIGRRREAARWRDAAGREPNYEQTHMVRSKRKLYLVYRSRPYK